MNAEFILPENTFDVNNGDIYEDPEVVYCIYTPPRVESPIPPEKVPCTTTTPREDSPIAPEEVPWVNTPPREDSPMPPEVVSCVNIPPRDDIPISPDSSLAPTLEPILITDEGTYPLPHDLSVPGEVAEVPVQFHIDTGAAISVVSSHVMAKSLLESPFHLEPGRLQAVKTVSGEQLPVQGKIMLAFTIENNKYYCEAHVIESVGYDFVLGRYFQRQNNAVIDLGGSTLRLHKDDISPNSEVLIPPKLEGHLAGRTGLFEPNDRLGERYQLQGAALLTLVFPDGRGPFRLLNPTGKPVTLYREINSKG